MSDLKKISFAILNLMGLTSAGEAVAQQSEGVVWEHHNLHQLGGQLPFMTAKRGGIEEHMTCSFGRNVLIEFSNNGETRITSFPISRIMIGEQPKEVQSEHLTHWNGNEYKTKICITNPQSGSEPLEMTAEVEQMVFSDNGVGNREKLNLICREGKWVDADTGQHDPRYDILTTGYTVIHMEKGGSNKSWHASAKTGFVPSENKS